jgi:anthranilate phosphoribosyltransferase
MNVVGPLANPASAGRQVIGVSDEGRLHAIAAALASLGTVHSLVVHGEPGMDEISPLGLTRVIELKDGATREWVLDPADYGYERADIAELAGGTPEENANLIERLFDPSAASSVPNGAKTAVVLNAAAAIYIAGVTRTFADGIQRAKAALAQGDAKAALARLRRVLPA